MAQVDQKQFLQKKTDRLMSRKFYFITQRDFKVKVILIKENIYIFVTACYLAHSRRSIKIG